MTHAQAIRMAIIRLCCQTYSMPPIMAGYVADLCEGLAVGEIAARNKRTYTPVYASLHRAMKIVGAKTYAGLAFKIGTKINV